jgi:hypothetical protein
MIFPGDGGLPRIQPMRTGSDSCGVETAPGGCWIWAEALVATKAAHPNRPIRPTLA